MILTWMILVWMITNWLIVGGILGATGMGLLFVAVKEDNPVLGQWALALLVSAIVFTIWGVWK